MDDRGPFDKILRTEPGQPEDRSARIVVGVSVVLGLVLLLLVLPPISIFSDGGGDGLTGDIGANLLDQLPPPPDGFEAVSELFDLSTPGGGAVTVEGENPRMTLSLAAPVEDGSELVFFTFIDDEWRRLGDATAIAGGTAAQGEVPFIPGNAAVFSESGSSVAADPDDGDGDDPDVTAEPVTSRVVLGTIAEGLEPDPRALDTITTLNVTGLFPAADGTVLGQPLALPEGIEVPIAPTISAIAQSEVDALNAILASPELGSGHVQGIIAAVVENDYEGIDIDYQTIDPARSIDFVSFIEELSGVLRDDGRSLTLRLPAPVQQDGEWETFGFDWQALAPLVDYFKLTADPEQDRYYALTEDALGYLIARVGNSKLLLTVGPLSRERGVDGISTLGLIEALAVASTPSAEPEGTVAADSSVQLSGQNLAVESGGSGLRWDETAQAVVFSYSGAGGERTVWLANTFSEAFRADLASRFRLGGLAVEDVSADHSAANIWPAVEQFAATGSVDLVIPNGDLLLPRWSMSGGSLDGDSGPTVTWQAPAEPGTYTLTLIVSDGALRVGQKLRVTVEASTQGAGAP